MIIITRTCADQNNCGTQGNQPYMSQPCSAAERKEAEQKAEVPITAFFLGLTAVDWAMAIVAGIVVATIIIFLVKRKGSKRK